MSHAKRLDKASSLFFLCGFVCAKLHHTPLIFVSALLNIISLSMYFIGYMLWLLACELHPDHTKKPQSWYGFSQFKTQHRLAAFCGLMAIFFCLIAIPVPVAILPACIFFALSSCIWCIAEYHKMRHPPIHDQDYSSEQQAIYMRYVVFMTLASILSSAATVIIFFCPPIALATMVIATGVGIILTLIAINYWIKSGLEKYEPDYFESSAEVMHKKLVTNPGLTLEPLPRVLVDITETDEKEPFTEDDIMTPDNDNLSEMTDFNRTFNP